MMTWKVLCDVVFLDVFWILTMWSTSSTNLGTGRGVPSSSSLSIEIIWKYRDTWYKCVCVQWQSYKQRCRVNLENKTSIISQTVCLMSRFKRTPSFRPTLVARGLCCLEDVQVNLHLTTSPLTSHAQVSISGFEQYQYNIFCKISLD